MTQIAPTKLAEDWQAANQYALNAALQIVRAHLTQWAARNTASSDSSASEQATAETHGKLYLEAAAVMERPPVLESLCTLFNLSLFERNVLLLCAGMELDGSFATLCAHAHGDEQRTYPTFGLALAALPNAHWSALTPAAPLRRWRLIEWVKQNGLVSAPLTTAPLRIDERVLHYLTGLSPLDERVAKLVAPVRTTAPLTIAQQESAASIAAAWMQAAGKGALPLIELQGADEATARSVAAVAARHLGLKLFVLPGHRLPAQRADVQAFARDWEREAAFSNAALLLNTSVDDSVEPERAGLLNDFIEQSPGALLVYGYSTHALTERAVLRVALPSPSVSEQRAAWQNALGETAASLNGELDQLSTEFRLSVPAIHAAVAETRITNAEPALNGLREACRRQTRHRLESLAQRIEPVAGWGALVLPEAQQDILRTIEIHVRQRARVYEQWGFATQGARGLGISALFAGVSGTGKTLAAEVLAHELRLDLYRIDLAAIVSKYIGETEKNLRRIFDAAEAGGVILFFDEADALFGKRSEVKDSHDRYANIEVSYLLQRMESYRGLSILTTNQKTALDTAFLRRIRFVVEFPFPDAEQRAQIWRRVFPAAAPLNGVDFEKLAQLNIAGGNIRNIAVNAAFLAAEDEAKVEMGYLFRAAQCEYEKIGRMVTEIEGSEWNGFADSKRRSE